MCEYMFTHLYQYCTSCILKSCVWKSLKNAEVFLASITDHYVMVGCLISPIAMYSLFLIIYSVSAPFLMRAHSVEILFFWTTLKVCSAVLIEASCLAENAIQFCTGFLLAILCWPLSFLCCIYTFGVEERSPQCAY